MDAKTINDTASQIQITARDEILKILAKVAVDLQVAVKDAKTQVVGKPDKTLSAAFDAISAEADDINSTIGKT